jgi:D-glycero-D-manno-heptose 1,7-bisphosphate phosphatase
MSTLHKAAFIDRDGVINEDKEYVHKIDQFKLIPGVISGLHLLHQGGYKLIVVTNQSGIARGLYSEQMVEILHQHMSMILESNGIELDSIYYCPHHPSGSIPEMAIYCYCRKPKPGMLIRAAQELDLDLEESIIIGDKLSDIQAGRSAGVKTKILVKSGHVVSSDAALQADLLADNLLDAAVKITTR